MQTQKRKNNSVRILEMLFKWAYSDKAIELLYENAGEEKKIVKKC